MRHRRTNKVATVSGRREQVSLEQTNRRKRAEKTSQSQSFRTDHLGRSGGTDRFRSRESQNERTQIRSRRYGRES